jgi:sialate O-acetylesterase
MNDAWRWRLLPATTLALGALHGAAFAAPPLLDEMFQDHAVLQRDRPIPVWGDAPPGDQITVTLGSNTVHVRASASGHWRAALPAMSAGGPYSLSAHGQSGAEESISDLLVGDVWLCSGQSNMEFAVANSLNASREIGASADKSIRVLSATFQRCATTSRASCESPCPCRSV